MVYRGINRILVATNPKPSFHVINESYAMVDDRTPDVPGKGEFLNEGRQSHYDAGVRVRDIHASTVGNIKAIAERPSTS